MLILSAIIGFMAFTFYGWARVDSLLDRAALHPRGSRRWAALVRQVIAMVGWQAVCTAATFAAIGSDPFVTGLIGCVGGTAILASIHSRAHGDRALCKIS